MGVVSITGKMCMVVVPVVLAIAVAMSQPYDHLGFSSKNMPIASKRNLLSQEEFDQYWSDGFLLKKGLVKGEELERLTEGSTKVADTFFWTDLVFGKFYKKLAMQTWKYNKNLAKFALESNAGSIAAQLLQEEKSIRILKDAIFAHTSTKEGCGFHVDDLGFWPANSTGVTFWIALSPMRVTEGGGIRVAKGSHIANSWIAECREAVTENATCEIAEHAPSCHERLYAMSETYDMEPGDAIIWDRYLFHRSDRFLQETDEVKLRYSIRYVPGNATAAGMHHSSVETGELLRGPHYPQVWPRAIEEEVEGFNSFGNSILSRLLPLY